MSLAKPQPAANASSNNKFETSSFESALDLDKFYDTAYLSKNADVYKSLDFSNVSIYGKGENYTSAGEEERFRHFHQMRLFIEKGTTQHHGNSYDGKTVITCNLPEQINYALDSSWEAPLQFGDPIFNLLLQLGGKAFGANLPSGTMRVSSLRIWKDTKPLSLQLTIPVLDDSNNVSGTNLVEALEILGSLALPQRGYGIGGFYIPPPSPLAINIDYQTINMNAEKRKNTTFTMDTRNPSRIILQLGGILLVDNCIIESVQVQYPNTKAQIKHEYKNENFGVTSGKYLHPLLAMVTLKISTLEALTADTYSRMLWARPQSDQGQLKANFTDITQKINEGMDSLLK